MASWFVAILIGIVASNKNRNWVTWVSISLILAGLDSLVVTGFTRVAGFDFSALQVALLIIVAVMKPAPDRPPNNPQ